MPLLGSLKASGSTIDQLADAISNQLQSKLGLTIRPQASIDIVQYRPFSSSAMSTNRANTPIGPG
jgi:polysaccharide biosynthesis/export protein ExoF